MQSEVWITADPDKRTLSLETTINLTQRSVGRTCAHRRGQCRDHVLPATLHPVAVARSWHDGVEAHRAVY